MRIKKNSIWRTILKVHYDWWIYALMIVIYTGLMCGISKIPSPWKGLYALVPFVLIGMWATMTYIVNFMSDYFGYKKSKFIMCPLNKHRRKYVAEFVCQECGFLNQDLKPDLRDKIGLYIMKLVEYHYLTSPPYEEKRLLVNSQYGKFSLTITQESTSEEPIKE